LLNAVDLFFLFALGSCLISASFVHGPFSPDCREGQLNACLAASVEVSFILFFANGLPSSGFLFPSPSSREVPEDSSLYGALLFGFLWQFESDLFDFIDIDVDTGVFPVIPF